MKNDMTAKRILRILLGIAAGIIVFVAGFFSGKTYWSEEKTGEPATLSAKYLLGEIEFNDVTFDDESIVCTVTVKPSSQMSDFIQQTNANVNYEYEATLSGLLEMKDDFKKISLEPLEKKVTLDLSEEKKYEEKFMLPEDAEEDLATVKASWRDVTLTYRFGDNDEETFDDVFDHVTMLMNTDGDEAIDQN